MERQCTVISVWISKVVPDFVPYSQLKRASSVLALGLLDGAVSYINAILAQDYGK